MGPLAKIMVISLMFATSCIQVTPTIVTNTDKPIESQQCDISISQNASSIAPSRKLGKIAAKTRDAAILVYHADGVRRGSGTYVSFNNHHLVITAAHVILDGPPAIFVESPTGERVFGGIIMYELSYADDYAIVLLEKPIESSTPMPLKKRQNMTDIIGEQLVYTGYPGHHDRLTIYGNVAGTAENGNLILHSYAWMGASGSGVYDDHGRLVGMLRAIDINDGLVVPRLTEDIVWVAPVKGLNLEKLSMILQIVELTEQIGGLE